MSDETTEVVEKTGKRGENLPEVTQYTFDDEKSCKDAITASQRKFYAYRCTDANKRTIYVMERGPLLALARAAEAFGSIMLEAVDPSRRVGFAKQPQTLEEADAYLQSLPENVRALIAQAALGKQPEAASNGNGNGNGNGKKPKK